MKKLLLMLSALLTLVGCSSNKLVGKWENTKIYTTKESVIELYKANGIDYDSMLKSEQEVFEQMIQSSIYELNVDNGTTIEFTSDGKYISSLGMEGNYSLKGNEILMDDGSISTYEIKNDILTIKVEGRYFVYKRVPQ